MAQGMGKILGARKWTEGHPMIRVLETFLEE